MSVTRTTDTTGAADRGHWGRGAGRPLRAALTLPLRLSGAGARRLGRAGRVLRGWWGLTLGVLVAAAVLLGPAGGARWLGHEATLVSHRTMTTATEVYQSAYVAVAWPPANAALWLDSLHHRGGQRATGRRSGQRATSRRAQGPHLPALPAFPQVSWPSWWRHGATWRYNLLQRPGQRATRRLIMGELAGGSALILLLVVANRLSARRLRRGQLTSSTVHGDAALATWKDLAPLRARPAQERVVLGTLRHRLRSREHALTGEEQYTNTLLVGLMGSGKSVIIKGNLLRERTRSIAVIDPKGEHFAATAGALGRTHDVFRVSFIEGVESCGWNPLATCQDFLSAKAFAEVWISNTGDDMKTPFWRNTASLLITASVLHLNAVAARTGTVATLPELADFLTRNDINVIEKALRGSPGPEAVTAAGQYLKNLEQDPRLRANIASDFHPRFDLLNAPHIRAVTGGDDVRPAMLADPARRPVALFIAMPVGSGRLLRPLTALLFRQLFLTLLDIAGRSPGQELPRHVMLHLDELGTVGEIPDLSDYLNVGRQARIGATGGIQVLSQLRKQYGNDGALALLGAFSTKVALKASGEEAEYFSKESGQTTVQQRSASASGKKGSGNPDQNGETVSETGRRLLLPDQLRRMPAGQMLVLRSGEKPFMLRVQQWWRMPALRAAARLPLPGPRPELQPSPAPVAATSAPAPLRPTTATPAALAPARKPIQLVAPRATAAAAPVDQPAATSEATASVPPLAAPTAPPPIPASAKVAVEAPRRAAATGTTTPVPLAPAARRPEEGKPLKWTGLP